MVIISKCKKTKVSLILIFVFILGSFAQDDLNNFNFFSEYRNYGFFVTPIFFKKASITRDFGNTTLENKSIFAVQFGVKKHFYKEQEWSIITGLNFTPLPFYNLSFKLDNEDVIFDEDELFADKSFGHFYISIPIQIEHKMQLSNKVFFNSNLGLNISYLSHGGVALTLAMTDEDNNITREVFGLRESTQNNEIQASATISAGLYFPLKYFLLQTNIVYNKTFQDVLEGEYRFGNLLISDPTQGNYKASGDFIGLSTTIYFKKRNKKSH